MAAAHDFGGRVAVVTGAAGDIGARVSALLAARGAAVAMVDANRDRLACAVDELKAGHLRVMACPCDVTRDDQVEACLESVVDEWGRLDLLFNNTGFQGGVAPVGRHPVENFRRVLEVNAVGAFLVLQAATPHLCTTRGAVVNTAGHAGIVGPPNMVAYAASKFAVLGLTQTAARDLAPFGVRVNAISPALIGPGTMWDRQVAFQAAAGSRWFAPDPDKVAAGLVSSVPLGRLRSLEEVARAVLSLLSDDASYITGANLAVTGGV